jgi:hypothetical protein
LASGVLHGPERQVGLGFLLVAFLLAIAIAHKIRLLRNLPNRDLGEAYLDQIGQSRTVSTLKRRLERLGYRVTLEPNAQAT